MVYEAALKAADREGGNDGAGMLRDLSFININQNNIKIEKNVSTCRPTSALFVAAE